MPDSDWTLPLAGLLIGLLLGGVARWNHFCTLSALERHWYANDSRGLRCWVLAIAVAIGSAQLLLALQVLQLDSSFYLQARLSLVGAVVGGVLFGLGMALVGTCGFGALIRLGGGSLRSLIVVVAIGLAALVAQRGLLGRLRVQHVEPLAVDLSAFNSQSLGDMISSVTGVQVQPLLAALIVAALVAWCLRDPTFRRDWRYLLTAVIVGLCVTAGWLITEYLSEVSFNYVQIESASFVMPPGEVLFAFLAVTGSIPDYAMGLVVGVVLGAMLVARSSNDMRWEACDDARELSRHLGGAFLMGTGGVLAGGCTVGQGISAASTLAISAPIVFASILLGARLGLRWLIEGPLLAFGRQ